MITSAATSSVFVRSTLPKIIRLMSSWSIAFESRTT